MLQNPRPFTSDFLLASLKLQLKFADSATRDTVLRLEVGEFVLDDGQCSDETG